MTVFCLPRITSKAFGTPFGGPGFTPSARGLNYAAVLDVLIVDLIVSTALAFWISSAVGGGGDMPAGLGLPKLP